MVKIFYYNVFIDDYGILVEMVTEIGLINILTKFPRRNKWITLESICALEIKQMRVMEHLETPDFHVRDPQQFLHRILMGIEEDALYNDQTRKEIMKYRSKHGRA